MSSLGTEQPIILNSPAADINKRLENREGSAERKAAKERDDKLKVARERQNEERQRKIEELKAQAEAAQKYREQKEEERRRRMEEIRHRDSEKRQQVEERKKAIMEAERERREYILRKNQERESRLELKKRERSSIGYAFGSSTPRLLEPADFGMVSSSTFWGQRRSTSISNVAGVTTISRRSSERELNDSGIKKRATSASDNERHDGQRRKSTSMYEVFNWNDEPPKRFSLSVIGSEINIDEPPDTLNHKQLNTNVSTNEHHKKFINHNIYSLTSSPAKEDSVANTSPIVFRSVARRKTDLMPTIPSPREGQFGSRSSLSTPRTPVGRAYSMNRLDQLAQPVRRNGEHIRAILERERREQMEMMDDNDLIVGDDDGVRRIKINKRKHGNSKGSRSVVNGDSMSRSMTHLASNSGIQITRPKYNIGGGISTSVLTTLVSGNKIASKSLLYLGNGCHTNNSVTPRSNLGLQTAATKKYLLQASLTSSCTSSNTIKREQLHHNTTISTITPKISTKITTTNPYLYDTDTLLFMNSTTLYLNPKGSRSGNVTPGGHINANSRPGSAMSTSTTLSTTGFLNRRSTPMVRKPRPASIAGTGVSLEEMNKLKKEPRPPAKPSTAQTTPKRLTNLMSTSLIVSPSARLLTPEKKTTPFKKEVTISKASTSKIFPKSTSSDRLNKISKEKTIENDPKSPILTKRLVNGKNVTLSMDNKETNRKSKEEKETINQVKTEESISTITVITVPDQPEVLNNIQTENGARNTVNSNITSQDEEKADIGSEKEKQSINVDSNNLNKLITDNNKIGAGSTVQELNISEGDGCTDAMTASMIAKSKITTEEEAKAALAERRRLAREEAERQAELERQRIEAERLAEIKRQEEEAERQRQFEEEAMRLAEEQRKAEEERLQQAIKEAKQREEMEKRKREEEERQRVEREEAEKKAKEEAEKQRIEVAERLKREEKEREERRKRVEAIMSRTRRSGTNSATPNSTPTKENHGTYTHKSTTEITNNVNATNDVTNATNSQEEEKNANSNSTMVTSINNSESNSTSSLSSVTTTTPTTSIESLIPGITTASSTTTTTTLFPNIQNNKSHIVAQNSQCMYEQSVINKENSLINCFSNLIINENAKNIQQQQQHQLQNQFMAEQAPHTIKLVEFQKNHEPVSNGNSNHIDIINKNECDLIKTVTIPSTNQLVDITMDSHDNINFKNNNSLLSPTTTTTTALVTADSHENKDISML